MKFLQLLKFSSILSSLIAEGYRRASWILGYQRTNQHFPSNKEHHSALNHQSSASYTKSVSSWRESRRSKSFTGDYSQFLCLTDVISDVQPRPSHPSGSCDTCLRDTCRFPLKVIEMRRVDQNNIELVFGACSNCRISASSCSFGGLYLVTENDTSWGVR